MIEDYLPTGWLVRLPLCTEMQAMLMDPFTEKCMPYICAVCGETAYFI